MPSNMTYQASGVDYDVMDAFKRRAQESAARTSANLALLDDRFKRISVIKESIGESATVYDIGTEDYIAHVEEGLGTKNLVAEAMEKMIQVAELMAALSGGKLTTEAGALGIDIADLFSGIGQCAAAAIANDLITVGAQPIGLNMHLAAGESKWFEDVSRWEGIVAGWEKACNLAGCAYGGGETPTLPGMVMPGTCLLSGSSWGMIPGKNMLHGSRIRAGDVIIFYASSGIHANGLTLCRKIAEKLPHGFFTKMADGEFYGKALLEPTKIYAMALNKALAKKADIHYAVNITGHGWRKIMRANEKFRYEIYNVPEPQEIFEFIMKNGPVDIREAYGNLNMGAGFAVIVGRKDASLVLKAAEEAGIKTSVAGVVEMDNQKSVVIHRFGGDPIIFNEEEMNIR